MANIKVSIRSDKSTVKTFLEELKIILSGKNFDMDENLLFIKSRKSRVEYSTPYTLASLDYDVYDVVERLKELTFREYSETLIDRDDDNPPLLFVFGKEISGRQIYIKLKIKGGLKRKILCLSFHYAEYEMELPYA